MATTATASTYLERFMELGSRRTATRVVGRRPDGCPALRPPR
ncbi:hypothetical protein ZOD2009_14306 [Haladaptatus paucihalophilus DX253]|uniref:Uncharacterized protein n=1 Tax=Haladaptatus paucihalophilus DX253 TaxID=797209 RepID=E7QVM5_HALPU|nr:hypothetical protein ZOD2009_14306 [Haladaptatus paucihalophilus DX253]